MKILKYIALCLVFLILSACTYVTYTEDNLMPEGFGIGAYPAQLEGADAEWLGNAVPNGSLVIADESIEPTAGDVAVYKGENRYAFAVISEDGSQMISPDLTVTLPAEENLGIAFYRIEGLGSAVLMLRENAVAVRAAAGLTVALSLVWIITLPSRRRKKEVRELIELFDYYGRKFDEEEEGIDY